MRVPILSVALLAAIAWTGTAAVAAPELEATMRKVSENGTGAEIGTVTVTEGSGGAVFATDLHDLPPGEHGFHIHEKGDCRPGPNDAGLVVAGGAAGSHWDPEGTKQHRGPQGGGHLGDLPALDVAADGTAKERLPAPRITDLARLKGRALVIHAGDDNYADQPLPLGGGGGRIACGVLR
jgi:superoxide dismutase, Cu-Zn family